MTARETYERVAQLINGTTRESNGFAVKVNEEYGYITCKSEKLTATDLSTINNTILKTIKLYLII